MRRWTFAAAALLGIAVLSSCVNVKAPDNIEIGSGGGRAYSSHSRNPNPQTLDEAKAELNKAYQRIDYLEKKNSDLEKDKQKYKDERDEYKSKYKQAKKQYGD